MFQRLRGQPERWLFSGFVAMLIAPVIAQGLDRPLAHALTTRPSGAGLTVVALLVAFAASLACASRGSRSVVVPSSVAGVVMAVVGLSLGVRTPGFIALAVVIVASVALTLWLPARLPAAFDGLAARHRALTACYALVALSSIVQVARVSVFIAEPWRTTAQVVPGVKFLETHSCLTAYVRANELAHDHVDNLYLSERWPQTVGLDGPRPQTAFSPFDIDEYFYPPPFLLVAEVVRPLRGDYFAQRAGWFGLNGALLAFAFWLGARAFGGVRWHRPLLLAPLFFGSLPVLSVLQIGNAQGAVVVIAVLSMFAFESKREAMGGFALALATMAKISPGALGVILIVQKRWRALAWTAGFAALLLGATVALYGVNPVRSWVGYMMPRLGSGEAFYPMLHHPPSIALNLAPSGTPYKLGLLGLDFRDPLRIARRIDQLFTLVVIVLAAVLGARRDGGSEHERPVRALGWMALLYLTALRSPFAPGYVIFAFAWAITFLSVEVERARGGVALAIIFAIVTLLPPLAPAQLVVYFAIPQVLTIGMAVWLIVRRGSVVDAARGTA